MVFGRGFESHRLHQIKEDTLGYLFLFGGWALGREPNAGFDQSAGQPIETIFRLPFRVRGRVLRINPTALKCWFCFVA